MLIDFLKLVYATKTWNEIVRLYVANVDDFMPWLMNKLLNLEQK